MDCYFKLGFGDEQVTGEEKDYTEVSKIGSSCKD